MRVLALLRVARAQLSHGDDVAAGDDLRWLRGRQALGLQALRERGGETHGAGLDASGPDLEQLAERRVDGDDARPVVVAGLEAPRVGREPVGVTLDLRLVPLAALYAVAADVGGAQALQPVLAHVEKPVSRDTHQPLAG